MRGAPARAAAADLGEAEGGDRVQHAQENRPEEGAGGGAPQVHAGGEIIIRTQHRLTPRSVSSIVRDQ